MRRLEAGVARLSFLTWEPIQNEFEQADGERSELRDRVVDVLRSGVERFE